MPQFHRTLAPGASADRLATIARDCEAARVPGLSSVRTDFQPAYDRLRQRFGRLARRHSEAKRLWSAGSLWEMPLEESVRSAAGQAASLLKDFEAGTAAVVPPTLVERAVDFYEQRINHAESQWELLDRIASYAEELFEELVPLARMGRRHGQSLIGLARRIQLDVRDVEHGAIELPEVGLPVGAAVSSLVGRRGVETCVTAVLAARLAAWVSPQFSAWSEWTESITLAALLQDAALTFWFDVHGLSPLELSIQNPTALKNHSRLSAALAGGVSGIDLSIRETVARHHERTNGTGFPDGLTQWRLGPQARLLGVCTRFVELLHGATEGQGLLLDLFGRSRRGDDSLDAGTRLLDEAERGAWDLTAVRGLLQSLDLLPPARQLDDVQTTATPPLSSLGERRLRRDSAHTNLRGPHGMQSPVSGQKPQDAEHEAEPGPTRIPGPHFLRRTAATASQRSPEVV